MIGTKQGITYFSDCKNISSITNPIIDNNVYMRLSGFLSNNWKQEDINFDTIGYGLYRDLSTKGTIWCNDASKLFTVNGTMNQGYIGITLSFPYAITNGVHELISDNKYFIFGTNVGIYDIKSPGFSLFLTKNGFEYTIMTSAGKFTMIDSYSTFSANEDIFIEFFWDKNHIYEAYDNCNVIVKANGVAVIGGNTPIHEDSLVGYKFYCLDTPVLSSTLKCTIKNLICYNTVPEYVDNLEYSSSSSSDMFSSDSSNSSSTENLPIVKKQWGGIAMSTSGDTIVATQYNNPGYFYVSANFGIDWNKYGNGDNYLYKVAMSGNANDMYATMADYKMKKTINSGLTWSDITTGLDFGQISSSSNGTRLAADSFYTIYLSTNAGTTWTSALDATEPLTSVDTSSNGDVIAFCTVSGRIIISTNYGSIWTIINTITGGLPLKSISISSTGQRMITCGNTGYIYISNNYGTSWNPSSFAGDCTAVTSSSTGQYLAIGVSNNYIYTSSNYGSSWTARLSSGKNLWRHIDSSSSGQYISVCENLGYIRVSNNYGESWSRARIYSNL